MKRNHSSATWSETIPSFNQEPSQISHILHRCVKPDYLKSLPSMPPAKLDANPPVERALLANVDAWLNRSQREKATVFVMVKARAIAISKVSKNKKYTTIQASAYKPGGIINSPTKLNQITPCNLTSARIASAIHNAGVAYRLNQKNLLSVALIVRVFGSELSKTQCESPLEVFTSFHHRRPTNLRPAMFLR